MTILNEMFLKSMGLIDEISPAGVVNEASVGDYRGKAPFIADMYHKEILNYTNKTIGIDPIVPITLTSLNDTLQTDEIESQLIAYGLAYSFMLSEQNENVANNFLAKYNQLKNELKKKPVEIQSITDVYGICY